MNNELSPLQQMLVGVEKQFSSILRDLHLSVINYIAGQVPGFIINQKNIAAIDSTDSWMRELKCVTPNDARFHNDLAVYKEVDLAININNGVWLKFPTVVMPGSKIHNYTIHTWKRYQDSSRRWPTACNGYDPVREWEREAFAANRLPTKEEFMIKNPWVSDWTKYEPNLLVLDMAADADLAGQIEKAYLKYHGSLDRAAKYRTTSADKSYKNYLAFRGKTLLAIYQLDQPTTNPVTATLVSAPK